MKINAVYVRVSTEKQSCEMQLHAIKQFLSFKGITNYKIYQDEGESGTKSSRPALNALKNDIKQGAIQSLCVYKLDRLFRSLVDLITQIKTFQEYGVIFMSVQDNLDLSTPQGVLMMQIIGAFSEFERNILSQRTKAGLQAAKARGKRLGTPPSISKEVINKVVYLYNNTCYGVPEIANECRIGVSTTYKIIKDSAKVPKADSE
jgi:DNA invertase Pin-like site-specific DNA recombinase